MELEKKIIEKIINNPDKYIFFYSPGCSYCDDARKLLRESKTKYKGYNIDKIPGGKSFLIEVFTKFKNKLKYDTTHTTKPFVFFNGKFIGGFNQLSIMILSTPKL